MTLNQPAYFFLPEDLAKQLGERARARRLATNLTRKTLAERSGVPDRQFESLKEPGQSA